MTTPPPNRQDTGARFTPGPWSWHECYDPTGRLLQSRDIVPAGGHSLNGVAVTASVYGPTEDAHLIAAAPELYEALIGYVEHIEPHLSKAVEAGYDNTPHVHLMNAAKAALAKARGEA